MTNNYNTVYGVTLFGLRLGLEVVHYRQGKLEREMMGLTPEERRRVMEAFKNDRQ